MKDCKKIHPMLADYLEGLLKPSEAARVESHLKDCAEGRKELEGLKRLRGVLAALPEPRVPQDLHGKIMARLQGRPLPIRPHRPFWIVPAGLMAVAASITVILLVQNPEMMSLRGRNKDLAVSEPALKEKNAPQAKISESTAAPKPASTSAGYKSLDSDKTVGIQTFGDITGQSNGKTSGIENGQSASQHMERRAAKKAMSREMSFAPAPAEEKAQSSISDLPPPSTMSFQGATTEKQEGGTGLAQAPKAFNNMEVASAPRPEAAAPARSEDASAGAPAAASAPSAPAPVTSWGGSLNPSTPESQQVVSDADSFRKYWQTFQPGQPEPSVDFTTQAVLVLMDQERPGSGYSIRVSSLEDRPDQLVVHYQVQAPAPGAVTAQVLTRPWAMQIIPKPAKPVVFQKDAPQ